VFERLAINHISIAVRNLDEAIEWYSDVFGLELLRRTRFDLHELSGESAFVRRGDIQIELWSLDEVRPVPPERRDPHSDLLTCGTKHLAFEVSDVQETIDELVARQVDIAGVQRVPRGAMVQESHPESAAGPDRAPARAAFVRDPSGTLIELLQPIS